MTFSSLCDLLCPHTHAAGKKIKKKAKKAPFVTFLERYLFGDDPDEKRFFKKTQKNPNHLQKFWKDTCMERSGFLLDRKKN